MNWIREHRHSAVLVGVTLLVPLVLYLYALIGLLGLGVDYAAQRGRIEPRIARIQGLYEQRELLTERSGEAVAGAGERAFPASEDTSALSATLQAQLRQLFSDAGMRVSNSQVLPPRDQEYFQRIAIKLTVVGPLPALDAALVRIAEMRPRLIIEDFDAYPERRRRLAAEMDGQVVTAVIQLFALRVLA